MTDPPAVGTSVRLSSARDSVSIHWPATAEGRRARGFLEPLLDDGVSACLKNVSTDLRLLTVGDLVVPISVNDRGAAPNCYVVSPHAHYIDYAREELRIVGGVRGEFALRAVLRAVGGVLRTGKVDRVVHVDNWLIATNLHPQGLADHVPGITAALLAAYPEHALAFRSVTPACDPDLATALGRAGYASITSRMVYLLDARAAAPFHTKSYKQDRRLAERADYEVIGPEALTLSDAARVADLYGQLYLDKYSHLNPQFTTAFVARLLAAGGLEFRALRRAGRIDGVVGFFVTNGVLATPFLGYDTSLPQELGLYRMLNVVLLEEGRERGLLLHQSSGVGHFKRSRGAVGHLETTAVYHRHLGFRRRAAWRLLAALANGIAAPLLRRYRW